MVSKDAMQAACVRYVEEKTDDALDNAIKVCRPLAIGMAKKIWWGMRGSADLDDVNSWALVGLWRAIKTFDPEKNEAAAYVAQKIRWEILDAVRKWAWFKRGDAHKGIKVKNMGMIAVRNDRDRNHDESFTAVVDGSEPEHWFIEKDYIDQVMRGAPRQHRLILTLMAQLGMNRREAADVAGYTASYVSKIWPDIQDMFRRAHEREVA